MLNIATHNLRNLDGRIYRLGKDLVNWALVASTMPLSVQISEISRSLLLILAGIMQSALDRDCLDLTPIESSSTSAYQRARETSLSTNGGATLSGMMANTLSIWALEMSTRMDYSSLWSKWAMFGQ